MFTQNKSHVTQICLLLKMYIGYMRKIQHIVEKGYSITQYTVLQAANSRFQNPVFDFNNAVCAVFHTARV